MVGFYFFSFTHLMLSNIKENTFKHYPKQISVAEAQQSEAVKMQ